MVESLYKNGGESIENRLTSLHRIVKISICIERFTASGVPEAVFLTSAVSFFRDTP